MTKIAMCDIQMIKKKCDTKRAEEIELENKLGWRRSGSCGDGFPLTSAVCLCCTLSLMLTFVMSTGTNRLMVLPEPHKQRNNLNANDNSVPSQD